MRKIILGTVQFGLDYGINNKIGKPDNNEIKSILDYAFDNKINFLDTAEAYGDSHERIGEYHANSNNKFKVITKFSSSRLDLPKNISDRINHHLKILNISNLYCYMFHNYDDFKNYFNLFKLELLELKRKGIIKKIGVSLHSNHNINDVLENREIGLIQLPYNLLDNKSKRENVFLKAKEKGVEIHTRSTFLQGLFFKDLDTIDGKLGVLKKYLLELKRLVNKKEINNLALNYVCSNANIDGVLLGVDTVSQLKNNLSCINDNKFKGIIENIDSINVKEENLLNPANW
ncbi:aldo/keto reductase [Polaribacter sp.]|uniref:aldo/keto reductase n=1 Tax=Polaribacter sp. TaxID=1920175 RepID=UPI0040472DCC